MLLPLLEKKLAGQETIQGVSTHGDVVRPKMSYSLTVNTETVWRSSIGRHASSLRSDAGAVLWVARLSYVSVLYDATTTRRDDIVKTMIRFHLMLLLNCTSIDECRRRVYVLVSCLSVCSHG